MHWKRLWCWEGLGAGGEGDDRGWDGWMASLTQWTWVWVKSGSWWWTRRPGVLQFMGLQRIWHDWATELNWMSSTVLIIKLKVAIYSLITFSAYGESVAHWFYLEGLGENDNTFLTILSASINFHTNMNFSCDNVSYNHQTFISHISGIYLRLRACAGESRLR